MTFGAPWLLISSASFVAVPSTLSAALDGLHLLPSCGLSLSVFSGTSVARSRLTVRPFPVTPHGSALIGADPKNITHAILICRINSSLLGSIVSSCLSIVSRRNLLIFRSLTIYVTAVRMLPANLALSETNIQNCLPKTAQSHCTVQDDKIIYLLRKPSLLTTLLLLEDGIPRPTL
jgi:hypothetical protein